MLKPRVVAFLGVVVAAGCSSFTQPPTTPATFTCSNPGEATPGPPDTHCSGQTPQVVHASSCFVDAAAAISTDSAETSTEAGDDEAGAPSVNDACDYGPTMFGPSSSAGDSGPVVVEGDDDDCKYHVAWTSDPICKSSTLGVVFTVTVTSLSTGLPVTDIPATEGILPEAFIPTTLDAACDTMTTHASPTSFGDAHLFQTTPGTYVGPIVFDQSGEWTVRFHIHEECADLLDDSPHGHAAFHVTVP